jgi:hypothetical protein
VTIIPGGEPQPLTDADRLSLDPLEQMTRESMKMNLADVRKPWQLRAMPNLFVASILGAIILLRLVQFRFNHPEAMAFLGAALLLLAVGGLSKLYLWRLKSSAPDQSSKVDISYWKVIGRDC